MQRVLRFFAGISTDSRSCPSASWKRNLTVPSADFWVSAEPRVSKENSRASVSRNPFGRFDISSGEEILHRWSASKTCRARYSGWPRWATHAVSSGSVRS